VRTVSPTAVFAEHGLITVGENGEFLDYAACCKSTALSAQVWLKDPQDMKVYEKTRELLDFMCREGIYGISRVYTAEEAQREERLAGGFSFVLESDGYSAFTNDWLRPIVKNLDVTDYRFGRATHGHHPDKGPQPTMMAFGPSFRPGAVVDRRPLVDQAATFAKVLGLDLGDIDGKVIGEILNP
ncbi:MAG TPA: alkaline phosphatase family protein, partial [Candidatus Limnocylindria bacterium]|nr:alkaline phosphatase family protein [Candidatus Limnocylindria bacterium]